MDAAIVFAILLASIIAYLLLTRWSHGLRARLGIAEGSIISADDSHLHASDLHSERLGLVGRCDHLIRVGRAYVPVEQKPTAQRLHDSHVLQVGALCLLVQEVYRARPPFGIVVLRTPPAKASTGGSARTRTPLRNAPLEPPQGRVARHTRCERHQLPTG